MGDATNSDTKSVPSSVLEAVLTCRHATEKRGRTNFSWQCQLRIRAHPADGVDTGLERARERVLEEPKVMEGF